MNSSIDTVRMEDLATTNIKIRICFKDRIGIVADISTLIAVHSMNILTMELIRKDDEAHLYLEIENTGDTTKNEDLLRSFVKIMDFREIKLIETLPQEEKANRFSVVLDNMSDGVLSIDKHGTVTTINKVACKVIKRSPKDVIGKNIQNLRLPEYSLLKCLNGKKLENVKQNLITNNGRYQYISTCKPIRDSFGRIIGAVEISKDMQEIKKLARSITEQNQIVFSDIIGKNPSIKEAISFAEKVSKSDMTISIQGASGTGKELFARAIHSASGRSGLFVPINCAALPEHLLESELFGYEKGTFTGGDKNGKPGLFEVAENGTIFLDEIAELPLGSQAKLLRLIQEKAVRRIGSSKEVQINARILTATNKNLEALMDNHFRRDLYYRICVLPIHISPLKQRVDDIPLLVEHFLFLFSNRIGNPVQFLTAAALQKLTQHTWPGNVRELKNVIERAAVLSKGTAIDVNEVVFSHELSQFINSASTSYSATDLPLKKQVSDFEKKIIIKVMETGKSIRQAAKSLGMSHPALLKKLQKHEISLSKKVTIGTKNKPQAINP